MGEERVAAKDGAWHHFSLPGALHGYMSEEEDFATRGAARVSNVEREGSRALRMRFPAADLLS